MKDPYILIGLLIGGFWVGWTIMPSSKAQAAPVPTLPKKCLTLPTGVVEYGLALQPKDQGIYGCFKQGAGQGMTEVRCVPFEDCH